MAQLFRPSINARMRIGLILAVAVPLVLAVAGLVYSHSDAAWGVGETKAQPVPFQHNIHVAGVGLDCRYCHAGVEREASAGMPSANTCLTCHAQVLTGLDALEPVRSAAAFGRPILWNRVHDLPDFAYFHHGAHTKGGVDCASCHGDVAGMAQISKSATLSMGWCLDCHRSAQAKAEAGTPARFPGGSPHSSPPHSTPPLTSCNTCHR